MAVSEALHTDRRRPPGRATRRLAAGRQPFTGPLLLERALDALFSGDRRDRPAWLCGPLVAVTVEPGYFRRILADGSHDAGDTATLWDAQGLEREIARAGEAGSLARLLGRLTARPVCGIDGVDGLPRGPVQTACAQLLDEAASSGTVFCLSLGRHPTAADLEPQLASRLCGGLLLRPAPPSPPLRPTVLAAPSLRRIIAAVARRHDLTPADLIGPGRCRAVATARGVAMYLARGLTALSLYEVGRRCGGRDHTTVMHAVRLVERQIAADAGFASDLSRLMEQLGGRSPELPAGRRDDVGSASGKPDGPDRHRRRQAARQPPVV